MQMKHSQADQVDGLFDFIGSAATTVLNPAQNIANSIVAGRALFDATRDSFRGTRPPPGTNSFDTSAGSTGERFEPGTTQLQTQNQFNNRQLNTTEIREVQSFLSGRGYNPGAIDGVYGPNTKAAIERYQVANIIPVTGLADGNLLNRIRTFSDQIVVTGTRTPQPSIFQQPIFPPVFQAPQAPAPTTPSRPAWVLPAAIAGGVGLLFLAMDSR